MIEVVLASTSFVASVGVTAYVAAMSVEHFERRESRGRFLWLLLVCTWAVCTSGAALFFLTRRLYDLY